MKKITLVLAFALALSASYAQKQDKRLKGLDKDLNEVLKETNAPGFAVAVVENNKIVYAKGFGYSNYEEKIPVDVNTVFAIGSSTKAFTGAVLGVLEDQEKLSFSDNPIKYIPELKFYNNELNNNVIIEDLMSHRTGLPRHDYSWYFFNTTNRDSLVQRIQYQEPFTGLRQQWYYNNFMYLLQGVIAERITKKTWEQNVQDMFLKPLNMANTTVDFASWQAQTNKAVGYSVVDGTPEKVDYYNIKGMAPAGSINSSVTDMSNWLITWLNDGVFKGDTVIPPSYVKNAMSAHAIIGRGYPTDDKLPGMYTDNYGFGWMISSYNGHYRVEHGGNIDGFTANVALYPTDKVGIVVLVNQNNARANALVRNIIADRMLGVKAIDWLERYVDSKKKAEEAKKKADEVQKEEPKEETAGTAAHPLKAYTGTYSNKGYGTFNIILKNDSLFVDMHREQFYLQPKFFDLFVPYGIENGKVSEEGNDNFVFNFTTNETGDISGVGLKIEAMLDHSIVFNRTPTIVALGNDALKKYIGDFEIQGAVIKVIIKNDNLYMVVPGQPEYKLLPTSDTLFAVENLPGYKVEFVLDDAKAVTAINLIQPNGTFKATKK